MPLLQPVFKDAELGLFHYPKEAVKLFVDCCTRLGPSLSIYHILVLKTIPKYFITAF